MKRMLIAFFAATMATQAGSAIYFSKSLNGPRVTGLGNADPRAFVVDSAPLFEHIGDTILVYSTEGGRDSELVILGNAGVSSNNTPMLSGSINFAAPPKKSWDKNLAVNNTTGVGDKLYASVFHPLGYDPRVGSAGYLYPITTIRPLRTRHGTLSIAPLSVDLIGRRAGALQRLPVLQLPLKRR